MNRSKAIIQGSVLLALIIGTLKSIAVDNKLPQFRFFFSIGVVYLLLNGLETFESEIARNIAIAIAVFISLRDGGQVMDAFLGSGSSSSILGTTETAGTVQGSIGGPSTAAITERPPAGINSTSAPLGFLPVKPIG